LSKRIHIVSFDVPYPADYGGVIDVLSRVKWFSKNGWDVVLHCFEYDRPKAVELNEFAEVHYYNRPKGITKLFSKLPFIVNTRINTKLKKVLVNTKDEVLLEGLHCSYYLNLQPGKFWVRTHNIEHDYYNELAKSASGRKRLFYSSETKKLKAYESILAKAKGLLVIAENEVEHFKKINSNSIWVPPLFENTTEFVDTKRYILFHGNLSVEENHDAAIWITDKILPHLRNIPFIFAGKEPSRQLISTIEAAGGKVISNPSEEKMQELIQEAAVHLLWTKQASGVKLKFLNALASSGHLLCSPEMVSGSGIQKGFHLVNSAEEIFAALPELMEKKLTEEEWKERVALVEEVFGEKTLLGWLESGGL
jgi:glycosyltransferase involved in cell wall biosynthesis